MKWLHRHPLCWYVMPDGIFIFASWYAPSAHLLIPWQAYQELHWEDPSAHSKNAAHGKNRNAASSLLMILQLINWHCLFILSIGKFAPHLSSNMKTQRETRSGPSCQTRRQTRSQTGRGGEIGPFPISSSTRSSTSNVAIIGGPKGPKRSTVEIETEKVEKKVKRAKTQKEALKEIARKATKDLLLLIQKNGYATTDSDTRATHCPSC